MANCNYEQISVGLVKCSVCGRETKTKSPPDKCFAECRGAEAQAQPKPKGCSSCGKKAKSLDLDKARKELEAKQRQAIEKRIADEQSGN